MKKKITSILVGLFLILSIISLTSAVWYNPFTWFSSDSEINEIQNQFQASDFKIQKIKQDWVQIQDDPDISSRIYNNEIVIDSSDYKNKGKCVELCKEKYDTKEYLDKEGKPEWQECQKDCETNKIPITEYSGKEKVKEERGNTYSITKEKGRRVKVGFGSDEYVYQDISMVQFIDGDLEINNTLEKYNGVSFVSAPEDIWIKTSNTSYKFGANDTIAEEDTKYKYIWESNQEIKYDSDKDYYYFDEYKKLTNLFSQIRTRRYLDVSDICSPQIINNQTKYPNCSYNLTGANNTILEIEFTGFYNNVTDMIFIDPSYSETDVSSSNTLQEQVRSESDYSHLEINDTSLVGYWSFDSTTQATDLTNNDNDGTFEGDAFINSSSGVYGGALELGGDGDYVDTNNNTLVPSGAKTFSLWVKVDGLNDGDAMFLGQSSLSSYDFAFYYDDNSNLKILNDNGGTSIIETSEQMNDSVWRYITYTYNGNSTQKLYINGEERASNENGIDTAQNYDLLFGGWLRGDKYLNGSIDEVQIFDRALSSTEIQEIYTSTYSRFYSEGNQTFKFQNITTGDNKVNITAEAETLNGTNLNVSLWEADVGANTGYINSRSGLEAYYHADGNAEDYSGNNVDLDSNGAVNSQGTGIFNQSFEFDGDGDYYDYQSVIMTTNEIRNNGLTYSTWIKPSEASEMAIMGLTYTISFTKYSHGGIYVSSGNNLRFDYYDAGASSYRAVSGGTNINTNEWNLVTSTYCPDDNKIRIYLNGELENTLTASTYGFNSNPDELYIGRNSRSDSLMYFNGSMDEIMILNDCLSAEEIKSLYVSGSTDHKNNGVGVNWTEGESQELTTLNSTHKRAGFEIQTDSNYLLPEFKMDSGDYNFYSPYLSNYLMETYQGDITAPNISFETPTTETGNYSQDYITANVSVSDDYGIDTLTIYLYNSTSLVQSNSSSDDLFINFTNLPDGDYYLNASVNDTVGNTNITETRNITLDTTAPNITTIPANATITYQESWTGVDFDATDSGVRLGSWSVNNSIFIINQTGYLNITSILGVGDYIVSVSINDSLGNTNTTTYKLTINKKSSSLNLNITNATYPNNGIINSSESNTGDGDLIYNLYINGSLETSGSDIDLSKELSVGTYNITYNTSGGTNYTSNSVSKLLEISSNTGNCDVLFNETSPLTYPETFSVYSNCNSDFTLYRNGTLISNNSVQSLGAGSYNFTVQRTDIENYTNTYDEELFVINKATGNINLLLNNTDGDISFVYGNQINASASSSVGQNIVLLRNGTDITSDNNLFKDIGAGYYNFTAIALSNENYTQVSETHFLTANKANSNCSITTSGDDTYGATTTISGICSNPEDSITLYLNDSPISNPFSGVLGAESYLAKINVSETENYTSASANKSFTISKATPTASLTNSRDWTFIYDGISATIGISESNSGDGDVEYNLYKDDVDVGTSDSEDDAGTYTYKINTTGGTNYTSVSNLDTEILTISKATPSLYITSSDGFTIPTFTNATITGNDCPAEITCNLYKNGVEQSNPDYLYSETASTYTYVFNTSGNSNYNPFSTSQTIKVRQDTIVSGNVGDGEEFGCDGESCGTFKQNTCIELKQTCSTCSYINITISYPNTTRIVTNDEMDYIGSGIWIYELCNTSQLGEYDFVGEGNVDGNRKTFDAYFEVNEYAQEPIQFLIYAIIYVLLLFSSYLLVYKFATYDGNGVKDENFFYWAAFLDLVLFVLIEVNGFGGTDTLLVSLIKMLCFGSGLYFLAQGIINSINGWNRRK